MTDFRDVPAPDSFRVRLIQDPGCGDPACTSCDSGLWLHFLAPADLDHWLLIAASKEPPQVAIFQAGVDADRYLRYAIALGADWDAVEKNARGLGLAQRRIMEQAPKTFRVFIETASIAHLKDQAQAAQAIAEDILSNPIAPNELQAMLGADASRPL